MGNFAALCLLALPALIDCRLDVLQTFGRPEAEFQLDRQQQPVGGRRSGGSQGGRCEGRERMNLDRDIVPIRITEETMEAIRSAVSPLGNDVGLISRLTVLMANSFFDAIAPYHPTAVGIYSNLGRRPAKEWTNRNKNIAILYCGFRVLGNSIPDQGPRYAELLREAGLDPNDGHESTTDPIGIGNSCGRSINEYRDNDGMNSKGDLGEGVSVYNRKPFRDYTNFKPVNPFDKLRDPRKWQPTVKNNNNGVFTIQKFIHPQMAQTEAYSFDDVNQFQAKPHGRLLDGQYGSDLYKSTTDEVIAFSAALTDDQKMAAEFFDDKLKATSYIILGSTESRSLSLDEHVFLQMVTHIATFDSCIALWKEKRRWNAVRPKTAISYLYGDTPITAYGGKGRGTVSDLPANAWESYLGVANHPEYPSITAAFCAALAESARVWFADEKSLLDPIAFGQGESRIEVGITPQRNISIRVDTWTDFESICGSSRLWGGAHFVDAVEEGNRIGNQIGRLAAEFVRRHINPTRPEPARFTTKSSAGGQTDFLQRQEPAHSSATPGLADAQSRGRPPKTFPASTVQLSSQPSARKNRLFFRGFLNPRFARVLPYGL